MKKILSAALRLFHKKDHLSPRVVREYLLTSGLFQFEWYATRYPEAAKAGNSPLEHYLTIGEKAGYHPSPYFDPVWYRGHAKGTKKYKGPALLHYALIGWKNGKDPSSVFSTTLYLQEYPEVLKADICPLQHYLQEGVYTGKVAFPRQLQKSSDGAKLLKDMRLIAESDLFNPEWYKKYYADFWDRENYINPLYHFVTRGHAQNRKPNPVFETAWYRQTYAKQVGKENPFVHYLKSGEQQGFMPAPTFCPRAYFKRHKNLSPGETSALKHYIQNGFGIGEPMPKPVVKKTRTNGSAKLPIDPGLRGLIDYTKSELAPQKLTFDSTSLKIHWVIPDFAAGGGGHMTIFRMTEYLERMGHRQTIWLYNPTMHTSETDAHDDILKHFQNFNGRVKFLDKRFEKAKGDIIIATDCWTVWPVLSASNFKRRFYFVQDYEPAFHPMGSAFLTAEQTYREDLDCICASPWLQKIMTEKYGRWAKAFWLAADTKLYFPVPKKKENKRPRIAFYARYFTARRAVELGMLALEELAKTGADFEVHFFGAPLNFTTASFPFVDHGVAAPEKLATIFQKADIGVVFSATNYSLVPQEMMACGLPIVELDGESTRAIFPDTVVTFAAPHPKAIAEAILSLLQNDSKRRKQSKAALEWVRSFSWDQSAKLIETAFQQRLESLFENKKRTLKKPAILSSTGIKASVVIPTLNAGTVFEKVLEAVMDQQTDWPFEVLVIDSGSTDSTLEIVAKYPAVKLHQIAKEDFNHGGTRNLGVELTTGDFIAFLTHDALPANNRWLHNLVTAIERFPNAAGAFGKHLAWPEASPFTKRDLNAHFDNMAKAPLYLDRNSDKLRYENADPVWLQRLHFYSDNNSCMRRSVWKEIPYRAIKFGEDQVWADDIIKAGYGKVYAIQAVVYHSHDYDENETYERSKIEAAFFSHFFGYTLIKNEEQLQKTIESSNQHDENWGKENKVSQADITIRKSLNASRLKGSFDGYHTDTDSMF
ncbi:rhamnosyltransferase WsaF family glycosyltransferase [Kordiimonas pumila]|uniref:Glycosyltransferase n=1 Tax=Kordiimonas pumila TaxID=2161677 RepID=A0ABV7D463_9PROT|nr:glycosyltransferase [Kordiimonas pumila]